MRNLVILFVFAVSGIQSLTPRWNDLKVTYSLLQSLPRTQSDAIDKGYTPSGGGCKPHPSFRGFQFTKNNDSTLRLLFDANGYIAGLQIAVPKDFRNGYPPIGANSGFVEFGDFNVVTVYFIDPAIICKQGRSDLEFQNQGSASGVYIQNGDNPENDIFEAQYFANESSWTEGLCFPGMGLHFYKVAHKDMSCDQNYPVALLYYDGVLTGFIFMFSAKLNSTSVVLEYPPKEGYKHIIKVVPTCFMAEDFEGTSLHVFLENDPTRYTCKTVTTLAPPRDSKSTSGSDQVRVTAMVLTMWIFGMLNLFTYN